MSEKLISVIVPVYKVEKYLNECVASIVNQTYKNLEIILVDDGSPDNCPQMCDEWAKKDNRIKVIHKPNGGVSSARNLGIDIAKGEYICFVDSDDYILENYCECMTRKIQQYNADIVICDLLDNGHPEMNLKEDIVFDLGDNENFIKIYKNYQFLSPTNKLFQKALIDAKFPIGVKYGEDEIFNLSYFKKVKKAIVIPEALYFYRENFSSVTHGNSQNLLLLRLKNTKNKYQLLLNILKDEKLAKYCATYMAIYNIQKFIHKLQLDKVKIKDIVNILRSLMEDEDVLYTLDLHEYGFSKNNDHFCNLLKKRKYKRVCRFVKLKYFLRKLLKK